MNPPGTAQVLHAFGRKLREIRRVRQMTQQELAIRSGLHVSQIGRIERGVLNARISAVFTLAHALNVHPKELMEFSARHYRR